MIIQDQLMSEYQANYRKFLKKGGFSSSKWLEYQLRAC